MPSALIFLLELVQFLWLMIRGYAVSSKRFVFSSPPKSMKNEVILVTGGSSGIGQALLLELAMVETELTLISWDIDQRGNEVTMDRVRALGLKLAFAYTVDVGNRSQVAAAAAKVREDAGDVTMVFNNAGTTGPLGKCWENDVFLTEKTFSVNLFSQLYIIQEFLPSMLKANKGHIIPTCSALSFLPCRDGAAYVGSKYAIRGYYECLKEDLRSVGSEVKVSIVYPGLVTTKMTAPLDFSSKAFGFLFDPITASATAHQIIRMVQRNEEYIYVPPLLHAFCTMLQSVPSEVYRNFLNMLDINILGREVTREKMLK